MGWTLAGKSRGPGFGYDLKSRPPLWSRMARSGRRAVATARPAAAIRQFMIADKT